MGCADQGGRARGVGRRRPAPGLPEFANGLLKDITAKYCPAVCPSQGWGGKASRSMHQPANLSVCLSAGLSASERASQQSCAAPDILRFRPRQRVAKVHGLAGAIDIRIPLRLRLCSHLSAKVCSVADLWALAANVAIKVPGHTKHGRASAREALGQCGVMPG